jgi:hypothetical protein
VVEVWSPKKPTTTHQSFSSLNVFNKNPCAVSRTISFDFGAGVFLGLVGFG